MNPPRKGIEILERFCKILNLQWPEQNAFPIYQGLVADTTLTVRQLDDALKKLGLEAVAFRIGTFEARPDESIRSFALASAQRRQALYESISAVLYQRTAELDVMKAQLDEFLGGDNDYGTTAANLNRAEQKLLGDGDTAQLALPRGTVPLQPPPSLPLPILDAQNLKPPSQNRLITEFTTTKKPKRKPKTPPSEKKRKRIASADEDDFADNAPRTTAKITKTATPVVSSAAIITRSALPHEIILPVVDCCCVCLDAPPKPWFSPCGHRCCCMHCARMLLQRSIAECPICRREIESITERIYQ